MIELKLYIENKIKIIIIRLTGDLVLDGLLLSLSVWRLLA